MAFSTDESAWDTFLAEWPIERLRAMTLDEYTKAGDRSCFVNWMEGGLDQYGSIWGGSAFKFGIYSRNDTANKKGDTALAYDQAYGWYRRFGATHDDAFEVVRREVVAVAEAARAGNLAAIDKSELGRAYRWKIAFHYQDRSGPVLFPCVFTRQPLLHACALPESDNATSLSELYRRVAALRPDNESVIEFSRKVWRDWALATPLRVRMTEGAIRNGYVSINLVSAPFPESIRGGASNDEHGVPVRFRTDTGWEFMSDVRAPNGDSGRIRTRLKSYFNERNVQAGDTIVIEHTDDDLFLVKHQAKVLGNESAVVAGASEGNEVREPELEYEAMPVNRILYGPPGTGKTFHTIDEALALLDPQFLVDNDGDRGTLKRRFDEMVAAGRVRFVTFHQSFSYEDFVEGIRATTDEETGALRYEVEDGVFKQICEAARSRTVAESGSGVDVAGRRIWKLSLGDSNTEGHIFDECMEQGCALLGFGASADLGGVSSRTEIQQRVHAAGSDFEARDYAITALDAFIRKIKPGDLVVVSEGNLKFRAIGEVSGDYVHVDRDGQDTYAQARPVRWLRRYDPALPYADLMKKRFSQRTIYEIGSDAIDRDRLAAHLAPEQAQTKQHARVLIIDEINRGSVSRIFGELITLIEPSKREGCEEALEVTLPYSKERFSVPRNVHLIATMNTADRSLAGLDVALRRRFEFVEMLPEPGLLEGVEVAGVPIAALLEAINRRIEVLLGRDYMVGHAYFMCLRDDPSLELLGQVFRRKVLPLLQEYFFEDWQKISWVLNDHRKPELLRFLVQDQTGLARLLGDEVEVPGDGRLWRLVDAAFDEPAAYRAIIEAPQGTA